MGFTNPEWTWSELEARLSGRVGPDGRAAGSPSWNAGGDAPAWSRRRQPFIAPDHRSMPEGVPYAELHCRSNFSFLEGASHPEALVVEASRLGLEAIAITDRDGLYGVVRFAEAAREMGIATMFGTEITLTGSAPTTDGLRPGGRLVLLADGTSGYARLSRAVSLGQLAGSKGAPVFELAGVAETVAGSSWVLTGGRGGLVPGALMALLRRNHSKTCSPSVSRASLDSSITSSASLSERGSGSTPRVRRSLSESSKRLASASGGSS